MPRHSAHTRHFPSPLSPADGLGLRPACPYQPEPERAAAAPRIGQTFGIDLAKRGKGRQDRPRGFPDSADTAPLPSRLLHRTLPALFAALFDIRPEQLLQRVLIRCAASIFSQLRYRPVLPARGRLTECSASTIQHLHRQPSEIGNAAAVHHATAPALLATTGIHGSDSRQVTISSTRCADETPCRCLYPLLLHPARRVRCSTLNCPATTASLPSIFDALSRARPVVASAATSCQPCWWRGDLVGEDHRFIAKRVRRYPSPP